VLDEERIQNALHAAVLGGTYHEVVVDANTGLWDVVTTATVSPGEVYVFPLRSGFSLDAAQTRKHLAVDRETWTWQAIACFAVFVSVEAFEQAMSVPIRLSRGVNQRQVTLMLREAVYEHPVDQEPNTGSRVVFTFEARLSPV